MRITTHNSGDDLQLFIDVVNQGIDARLEGFVKSKFTDKDDRLILDFHPDEMSVLLRRLDELWQDGNDLAGDWADDIVLVAYGHEVV